MNFWEFLGTLVTTTVLVGGAQFLAGHLILVRLTRSVQHEFDTKLADVNSRLRTAEETFKAELNRKQAEIVALQKGALEGRLSRVIATDKRRLEAVDQLWGAVHELTFAKGAASWMASLKREAVSAAVAKNDKLKEMFAMLKVDGSKAAEPLRKAQSARPFVTTVAWAYYAAFETVAMHAVGLVNALASGLDAHNLMNDKPLLALVKVALPDKIEHLEKFGPSAAYSMLDELEGKLLQELKNIIDGAAVDVAEVSRAQEILVEVQRANRSLQEAGE